MRFNGWINLLFHWCGPFECCWIAKLHFERNTLLLKRLKPRQDLFRFLTRMDTNGHEYSAEDQTYAQGYGMASSGRYGTQGGTRYPWRAVAGAKAARALGKMRLYLISAPPATYLSSS